MTNTRALVNWIAGTQMQTQPPNFPPPYTVVSAELLSHRPLPTQTLITLKSQHCIEFDPQGNKRN